MRGRLLVGRLVCALIGFVTATNLVGTEFGCGRLTGVLVRLCLGGSVLLLLGGLVGVRRRAVGVLDGIGALLCLPLFLYRVAPWSVSWMSDAPASVSMPGLLAWDAQGMAGLAAVGVLALAHASARTAEGGAYR